MGSKSKKLKNKDEEAEEVSNVNISELVTQLGALLCEKYPNLRLPPDGDQILKRSLCHRKNDMNQAANQVHSLFKLYDSLITMKIGNIFRPSAHQSYFFDTYSVGFLKQKDSNGTPIFYANYETMPGETFSLATLVAVWVMLLNELCQQSLDNNKNVEVVAMTNLKGFGFLHAKQFSFALLKACSKILQGAIPVSFKAIHCINVPSIFQYVFTMIKPFLRQKIRDRIHMHGDNLTEFYKVVDKSLLPIALDGDLPNEEGVNNDIVQSLCKKDEYYAELMRHGYTTLEETQN